MRKALALAALAIPAGAALALVSRSPVQGRPPDSAPIVDKSPCRLARAQGGSTDIHCKDELEMKEAQGLDGKSAATVGIKWPAEDATISRDDCAKAIDYELTGFEIGKDGKGDFQHCHVVLDDEPYVADYDHRTTLLALNGGKEIPEGSHVLTIFPARSFHLSVKNPGACAQVRFHVGKKSGEVPGPLDEQLIFSRPEGEYDAAKGEADAILIDYYLLNVPMNEKGYLTDRGVRYTITDDKGFVKVAGRVLGRWHPFPEVWVPTQPLSPRYTITLELVKRDESGAIVRVPGPFNKVSREITIKLPPEPAPPAARNAAPTPDATKPAPASGSLPVLGIALAVALLAAAGIAMRARR